LRLFSAHSALLAALVLSGSSSSTLAQNVPWDFFPDSPCDVVNAGNLEFVVLTQTGELVVVTEEDYSLGVDAFVNLDGVYFFAGIPFGQILSAYDGNGFLTVWLLAPDGTVLELDPDTGGPIFTDLIPDDFLGVPCDAFALWDDDDFDGVLDEFDACPLDFGDYSFGCPCEVFDDDEDAVNNCFDSCPNTPIAEFVDNDGCEIIVVVQPPPVTVIQPPPVTFVCGNFSTLTLAMTFGALVTLRLARRRYS